EGYVGVPMYERSTSLLLVALWFALMAGLIEVVICGVRKMLLPQSIQHVSPHVVWMAPLVNVCLFSVIGLVLLLLIRLWSRLSALRVSTFIFAFLACLSPLLMFVPSLHLYAVLCLAFGLATQVAGVSSIRPFGFYKFVRRTLGWELGLIVGLAMGAYGWQVVP